MDNGAGTEEGVFRPGAIVSSDQGNKTSPNVTVCFMSTQSRAMSIHVETNATGIWSRVLCGHIMTVDKTRLGTYLGKMDDTDMRRVDAALMIALGIDGNNTVDSVEKDKRISELNTEAAALREETQRVLSEMDGMREEVSSLKIEAEMWQRLYEKALDQVVSMKLTGDVARRTSVEKPVVEPGAVVEPVVIEEPELRQEKVNINTASSKEIAEKTGMSPTVAMAIVGTRKREGLYESLEELLLLDRFTEYHMKKFGHLLEV